VVSTSCPRSLSETLLRDDTDPDEEAIDVADWEASGEERQSRGVRPDDKPRGGVKETSGALVGEAWDEGDKGLGASAASARRSWPTAVAPEVCEERVRTSCASAAPGEEVSGKERLVRGVCPDGWPRGGVRETSGALVGDVWEGDEGLSASAASARRSQSADVASSSTASNC
jgi:hypothetical protein